MTTKSNAGGNVEEDIQDIRSILEDNSISLNNTNNNTNNNTLIQYSSSSHTYTQPQKNIQSHIATQSITNFHPNPDNQAHIYTQSHTNFPCSSSFHNNYISQTTQLLTQDCDVDKTSYADNTFVEFQNHSGNVGVCGEHASSSNWNVDNGGSMVHGGSMTHRHLTQSDIR